MIFVRFPVYPECSIRRSRLFASNFASASATFSVCTPLVLPVSRGTVARYPPGDSKYCRTDELYSDEALGHDEGRAQADTVNSRIAGWVMESVSGTSSPACKS